MAPVIVPLPALTAQSVPLAVAQPPRIVPAVLAVVVVTLPEVGKTKLMVLAALRVKAPRFRVPAIEVAEMVELALIVVPPLKFTPAWPLARLKVPPAIASWVEASVPPAAIVRV